MCCSCCCACCGCCRNPVLRLIAWCMLLLVIIAEIGFLITDAVGLDKFGNLKKWDAGSGHWGSYDMYFSLIAQIVMVFLVPGIGPVVAGFVAISFLCGGLRKLGVWETLEERYPISWVQADWIPEIKEWTEVDECMHNLFDNEFCTLVDSAEELQDRIDFLLDMTEMSERDVGEMMGGSKRLAATSLAKKGINSTLIRRVHTQQPRAQTLDENKICLADSEWTLFVNLMLLKYNKEAAPFDGIYDTLAGKLCKKPLAAQRTFISFGLIGLIGLLLLSFVGCCYCPVLDEKLPTLNINIPGGGLAKDKDKSDVAEA